MCDPVIDFLSKHYKIEEHSFFINIEDLKVLRKEITSFKDSDEFYEIFGKNKPKKKTSGRKVKEGWLIVDYIWNGMRNLDNLSEEDKLKLITKYGDHPKNMKGRFRDHYRSGYKDIEGNFTTAWKPLKDTKPPSSASKI